jgi:quercetin dioxygenase-like cupin family protein
MAESNISASFSNAVSGSQRATLDDLVWDTQTKPGVSVAILYRHETSGEYTALVDMAPGTNYAAHTHELLEEVFVISGTFYDSEKVYHPGDYVIRAPGAIHTTRADEDCRVLVTYRRF